MYTVNYYHSSSDFYQTLEECEKWVAENISPGEKFYVAELVKAFKAPPSEYVSVDIKELENKILIEQNKKEKEE